MVQDGALAEGDALGEAPLGEPLGDDGAQLDP